MAEIDLERAEGPGAVRTPVRVTSRSAAETRSLAARLAGAARAGDVIALEGELGAGKTQFAKGFAQGLGVRAVVNSPSFTLMAEYAGRLPLFHLDLYRLRGTEEALAGGLLDERQQAGVTLIEWADRLRGAVGTADLEVRIAGSGEEVRELELRARDAAGERYLAVARGDEPRGGVPV
ncbi:MAG: tRNA (adenosine(37)-N6)-threonylcarbamoyltransferase complex ATPase subunit type 1 TsaE [Candidatus Limnocylindrales bacterium]